MSQEKAGIRNEAVRRFLATFEDEDDAFRAALHPEIEWYPIEETYAHAWHRCGPGEQESVARYLGRAPPECGGSDRGRRQRRRRIHIKARGQGSGVEADVRFYAQFKVRDGKVAYIYDHDDRVAALEAARAVGVGQAAGRNRGFRREAHFAWKGALWIRRSLFAPWRSENKNGSTSVAPIPLAAPWLSDPHAD